MRFKEILSKVQSSDEFKKWYAEHDSAFFAHIFFTDEQTEEQTDVITYDVGYYVPTEDKIASFEVGDGVCLKDYSEVFKKPGTTLKKIEIEKIKISAEEALDKAKEEQEKKHSACQPFKRIVILQHLDVGQVWNITYITRTFKTLNIKVSAETGKIVEDKIHNIFEFDKQAA